MLLVTHRHVFNKSHYTNEDPRCAYRVKLGKFSFDFDKGLQVELRFLDRIPSGPLSMGRLISHTYEYKRDLTKVQYEEIKSRILAHNVVSYSIIESIINDVISA